MYYDIFFIDMPIVKMNIRKLEVVIVAEKRK